MSWIDRWLQQPGDELDYTPMYCDQPERDSPAEEADMEIGLATPYDHATSLATWVARQPGRMILVQPGDTIIVSTSMRPDIGDIEGEER